VVRRTRQGRSDVGEGVLTRGGDRLVAIAAAVGTPAYVYDAAHIRDQYTALSGAMAPLAHRIFYSVKANGSLAVLGLLRRLGAGADIVSVGELHRCLRAGFSPSEIVFGGVGKRPDELTEAVSRRVRQINVESFAELRLVAEIAASQHVRAAVGIRINPDVATDTHPYTQTGQRHMKFGAPVNEVGPMAHWCLEHPDVELASIGMHIGSQIFDGSRYREGGVRLAQVVEEVRRAGVTTVREVSVGGGIGIRYRDEHQLEPAAFAEAVRPLAEGTGLPVHVEPGRFLVANAGVLLSRCIYRKRAGGKTFVVVDAGMNDLLRPSLYGAAHEVVVLEPASSVAQDGDDSTVDIVGPVCESGDFLALARDLGDAGPGALIGVLGAGAYGFVMSSNYNGRPRATEVLLDGDRWTCIRARESVEDLMRGEERLEDISDWETLR